MSEEKWLYTPGARSVAARLQHLAGPTRILDIPGDRPSNSAIPAGWVLCALGVLCAWLLPLAHVFFAVAFILAVVGMSTHQLRQGTILMVVTVACATLCALAWAGLILNQIRQRIEPLAQTFPAFATVPSVQSSTFSYPTRVAAPAFQPPTTNAVSPVKRGPVAVEGHVGGNSEYAASSTSTLGIAAPRSVAYQTIPSPAAANQIITSTIPAGNYQDKERRIQELRTRIDALDEDVRCIRVNPKSYRYWWSYYGNGNSNVDSVRRDAYLKQLDEQRNGLRREKWQLEGR